MDELRNEKEKMRHGSLFSGIGGFDLAASWLNWTNVFQVEIDPFCQAVLKKNFPTVERYGDIKEFDGTKYRGAIDILTGGFPCQPFSNAGKRKGKDDDRYLWPQMLRVIDEVKPTCIVGENVGGSWQLVDQICTELEHLGYITEPTCIEAACVEANHRRLRYWFIAYTKSFSRNSEFQEHQTRSQAIQGDGFDLPSFITDSNAAGLQGGAINGSAGAIRQESGKLPAGLFRPDWKNFPTQSPICGRDDGIPNRVDRIKGLGNAIVPQVAYEIFKAIEMTMRVGAQVE